MNSLHMPKNSKTYLPKDKEICGISFSMPMGFLKQCNGLAYKWKIFLILNTKFRWKDRMFMGYGMLMDIMSIRSKDQLLGGSRTMNRRVNNQSRCVFMNWWEVIWELIQEYGTLKGPLGFNKLLIYKGASRIIGIMFSKMK